MLVCLIVSATVTPAFASIGLVVGEPFGSFGTMMPVGHAGVYLDHLCAASPTQLRMCRPGEQGVVISRYHDLKTTHTDWLAYPLSIFLFGVAEPADAPESITRRQIAELREQYREAHLLDEVPDRYNRRSRAHGTGYGDWEEGIGAAFDRNLFAYVIDTTPAQDTAILSYINADANRRRYTLGRANCADFAADLLRIALPGVFHRNVLADFDMTTPKSLAWQMDDYARAHPELHLRVYKVPQIAGDSRRSRPVRGAAELLLKTKRYCAALFVLQPELLLLDWSFYEARGKWNVGSDAAVITPGSWWSNATSQDASTSAF